MVPSLHHVKVTKMILDSPLIGECPVATSDNIVHKFLTYNTMSPTNRRKFDCDSGEHIDS